MLKPAAHVANIHSDSGSGSRSRGRGRGRGKRDGGGGAEEEKGGEEEKEEELMSLGLASVASSVHTGAAGTHTLGGAQQW